MERNAALSKDEIERIIKDAFKPLRCVAEPMPYWEEIAFQVKDANGDPIHTEPAVPIGAARNPAFLTELLTGVRSKLEAKGHKLDHWVGPRTSDF